MELRSQPYIRFHGLPTWPPVWNKTSLPGWGKTITGEVGVLKRCSMHSAVNNICFLFIEQEGESYCGALVLDDPALCRQLLTVFNQNIGQSIAKIGSLDLS